MNETRCRQCKEYQLKLKRIESLVDDMFNMDIYSAWALLVKVKKILETVEHSKDITQ